MQHRSSFILSTLVLCALPRIAAAQPDLASRVAIYNDAGFQSWTTTEVVYGDISGTSNTSYPQKNLVYHAGNYYHVFAATDGDLDVYLRESADGLTWTPGVLVNDDVPGGSTQNQPNLVVFEDDIGGTTVVVSWLDHRATSLQLRTATSTDGGTTFAASVPVSTHADALALSGNVAIDGAGRLYAAWSRFDGGCWGNAWFSTSDDAGATWSPMTLIFSGGCYSDMAHVMAGGPDSVMVVVSDDQFNHKNVIVRRSVDGGVSFTQASVSTYTITQSITEYTSSVVDPSGRAHLVFTYGETLGTASSINYATSTDWGATWTVPVAVSDAPLFPVWGYHSGQIPAIASAPLSNDIYIAWADPHAAADNFDVYLTRSADGGLTWDADQLVNSLTAPLDQNTVSLALVDLGGGSANVTVVWNDDRNEGLGVPDHTSGSSLVHPVPAMDQLNVDLSWATGPLQFQVIDARGAIVEQGTWSGGMMRILDVRHLDPGMHLLRLVAVDRVVAIPWVKE